MPPTSAPDTPAPRHRAYLRIIMGLPFSLHLRGDADPARERAAVHSLWESLRSADRIFSPFLPASDISRIGRGELAVDDADPAVAEVLALAEGARRRTAGTFDVHYSGRLEPSGIVKSWAAARAAEVLDTLGTDWYLGAGGDVLLASPWSGAPWRVGIEHPTEPAALLRVVSVVAGAVATSGIGRRGRHIVDPATGAPATGVVQATVVGPDLVWADVFATAIVAGGGRAAGRWQLPAGYSSLIVTDRGEVIG